MATAANDDPRYIQGVERFNAGDYFEAHEVWEELWLDGPAEERRFIQGLIQAAVALYHASRKNGRGARRLFQTGRGHMAGYGAWHRGLAIPEFWQAMETALATCWDEPSAGEFNPDNAPRIEIRPELGTSVSDE
jgi:hypothetical protein